MRKNISISISKRILTLIETNISGRSRSEKIAKCCEAYLQHLKKEE